MNGSTRSVARAFAADRSEPSKANSVFHDGRVIYSYGHHWPLAVKLDDKRVLLNNDKRSMTTSHHRSAVAGALAVAGWTIIDSDKAECQAAINGGLTAIPCQECGFYACKCPLKPASSERMSELARTGY